MISYVQSLVTVRTLISQLDETRSTIHFFEQKNMDIQNEAVYCEESTDEYTHLDPVYIQMHFPEENASRFFLTNLIEFCMTQVYKFKLLLKFWKFISLKTFCF